jgi:hypothetical protein
MKTMFSIAAITSIFLGGASATAAEFPTFELDGLPITAHQVALLGAAGIQETSATATLTVGGMPASPHQIAVLTRPQSISASVANRAIEVVRAK